MYHIDLSSGISPDAFWVGNAGEFPSDIISVAIPEEMRNVDNLYRVVISPPSGGLIYLYKDRDECEYSSGNISFGLPEDAYCEGNVEIEIEAYRTVEAEGYSIWPISQKHVLLR